MITIVILVVALALTWLLIAGGSRTGALTGSERAYLVLCPLPVALAIGISVALTALRIEAGSARLWGNRLSVTGTGLGLVLVIGGVVLLWRRKARGAERDGRLAAAIFLAAIPVLLWLAVVLMYSL